jgi:hypothetical protein
MSSASDGPPASRANGSGRVDSDALRAEIRRTRAELGETVQALAARADVKARAKESVSQAKERVRERAAHAVDVVRGQAGGPPGPMRSTAYDVGGLVNRNSVPLVALLGAAAAIVVVLIVIRGRNNR